MSDVDAPSGVDGRPLVPAEVWATFPVAAQAVIVALAQQAEQQARRVLALEAEVGALRARLGQTSANSSRPPSSDPPWARVKRRPPPEVDGRRPGGQPGHAGHFRALTPPERVDAVADHWPAQCAGCGMRLPQGMAGRGGVGGDYASHQVTDLPALRATITEHRRHRVVCAACGVATRAALPAEVPAGVAGPRLQAVVATLSGPFRLSRRQVVDLCGTLLDAPISLGTVDALCRATGDALATPVEALVATLPRAPVVHADETPWRQQGPGGRGQERPWLWVATSALATVFRIAPGRNRGVIQGLIGTGYTGTLVTDRYSAYAWLDGAYRQVCWAHLTRDFQALVDRGGPAVALGRDALIQVRRLFAAWHRFRRGMLDRAGLGAAIAPVDEALGVLLLAGQEHPDGRAAGLCRALLRLWPALWTFAEVEGVEPTNNAAERALRPAVLWRKTSFGTRCPAGAHFVERVLTVVATCRLHARSVLDYLTDVCTAAQQGLSVPPLLPATA